MHEDWMYGDYEAHTLKKAKAFQHGAETLEEITPQYYGNYLIRLYFLRHMVRRRGKFSEKWLLKAAELMSDGLDETYVQRYIEMRELNQFRESMTSLAELGSHRWRVVFLKLLLQAEPRSPGLGERLLEFLNAAIELPPGLHE